VLLLLAGGAHLVILILIDSEIVGLLALLFAHQGLLLVAGHEVWWRLAWHEVVLGWLSFYFIGGEVLALLVKVSEFVDHIRIWWVLSR